MAGRLPLQLRCPQTDTTARSLSELAQGHADQGCDYVGEHDEDEDSDKGPGSDSSALWHETLLDEPRHERSLEDRHHGLADEIRRVVVVA